MSSAPEAAIHSACILPAEDNLQSSVSEDSLSFALKRKLSPDHSVMEDGVAQDGVAQMDGAVGETDPEVAVPTSKHDRNKKQKRDRDTPYHALLDKDNPRLAKYIRSLGLVADEEWDAFWELLKEPLPTSFRITGFRRDCEALKTVIHDHFLAALPEDTRKLCEQITWYPDQLAWQINMHRRIMRRSDDFKPLREFIINETASGNISRQETVSMIPPVFLDVRPGHKVLDMCAAPGSKTAQIVDMLQGDLVIAPDNSEQTGEPSSEIKSETPAKGSAPRLPDGLVVANDMEIKRCNLLTHQIKRLQSPCVIVTNHDASMMPNIALKDENGQEKLIEFDRILCDVPCSGDGTIRKNLDLWRTWHPHNSLALHPVQYRILKRGLEMLAVGGRLIYSTCSMNPVENEAVLCRMLNETRNTVELVDCSARFPELKRMPGMKKWNIMAGNGEVYADHQGVPGNLRMKVREDFFAPANVDALKIDRCMRVMPHQQNTGAFFIAVLQKKATLPWQKYAPLAGIRLKPQQKFESDPLVPFAKEDPETWETIKSFFSIHPDFPADQLFIRKGSQDKSRHVYMVSKVVKEVLECNLCRVRIINAGVRILTRTGAKESVCSYRLAQEGLQIWMEHLGVAKLTLTKQEIETLLLKDFIEFTALRAESRAIVDKIPVGSVIVRYEKPEGLMFELTAWRAVTTVRCYVAKEERGHYMRLLQIEASEETPSK